MAREALGRVISVKQEVQRTYALIKLCLSNLLTQRAPGQTINMEPLGTSRQWGKVGKPRTQCPFTPFLALTLKHL